MSDFDAELPNPELPELPDPDDLARELDAIDALIACRRSGGVEQDSQLESRMDPRLSSEPDSQLAQLTNLLLDARPVPSEEFRSRIDNRAAERFGVAAELPEAPKSHRRPAGRRWQWLRRPFAAPGAFAAVCAVALVAFLVVNLVSGQNQVQMLSTVASSLAGVPEGASQTPKPSDKSTATSSDAAGSGYSTSSSSSSASGGSDSSSSSSASGSSSAVSGTATPGGRTLSGDSGGSSGTTHQRTTAHVVSSSATIMLTARKAGNGTRSQVIALLRRLGLDFTVPADIPNGLEVTLTRKQFNPLVSDLRDLSESELTHLFTTASWRLAAPVAQGQVVIVITS